VHPLAGRATRGRVLRANNLEQANTDCHRPPEDTVSEPALFISLLTIELVIPWAQSLKDRRSAVRGLKDRLRSRFNASVAEVAFQDKWQRATIAVCIVDSDRRQLESVMNRVRQTTEAAQDVQITVCSRNGCRNLPVQLDRPVAITGSPSGVEGCEQTQQENP
jgi:uncharacterized protein YlxP (DUF503 family)